MLKDFHKDYSPDLKLNDVSPTSFALFAHWLYKGQFPELEADLSTTLSLYLEAFVFGDTYNVCPFKQSSLDKIKELLSKPELPAKKFVREVFSYGDLTQSLQEVLVEAVTKHIHDRTVPQESDPVEWLNSIRQGIPKFSMDVAESLTRRVLKETPAIKPPNPEVNHSAPSHLRVGRGIDQTIPLGVLACPINPSKRTLVSNSSTFVPTSYGN